MFNVFKVVLLWSAVLKPRKRLLIINSYRSSIVFNLYSAPARFLYNGDDMNVLQYMVKVDPLRHRRKGSKDLLPYNDKRTFAALSHVFCMAIYIVERILREFILSRSHKKERKYYSS